MKPRENPTSRLSSPTRVEPCNTGLDTVPRNLPGLAMNFRQRVQHQGSLTTPLPGPVRQGSLSNQGGGGSRIRPTRQASQWSQSPHFSMSLAVPGHGAHTPSRRSTWVRSYENGWAGNSISSLNSR
ncbi:uncharacterized protein LOC111698079 [Eurytemora carolleeae]|uniref:uncharacterized protein LOC111698079 n=1 Tax=Eurytemora carolleeae TaxID=1294199 RepID=UPI000C781677|nr:uncharacterized protein LOC111698079 [Eurytemora carolleeae]|eukprot:XP_023324083.1 uncharacterized protein LOC111698079 [Eurytemora affinis]